MNRQELSKRLSHLNELRATGKTSEEQEQLDTLNEALKPDLVATLIDSPYPDLSGQVVEYAVMVRR